MAAYPYPKVSGVPSPPPPPGVDDSETKCNEGGAQEILDHLNTIEPGVIVFTKEDQEGDVLPVLKADCKQKDQEDNLLCPLQEDSHKHKRKEKIQSPRKYEKSYYKRFC